MKKYSEKEEREIIAGCAIASEKHQELLYKWYYGYVMAISLSYCTSRDIAQEITHDSFMKIFGSLNKFDEKQALKSWIRKITVNTAIDYYRRNKKHLNHLDVSEYSTEIPSSNIIDQLSIDDIYKIIEELPEMLKVVFNLYEIEGYSHKEIVRLVGIKESSSRTYLMRAKMKLRGLMQKHFN